MPGVIIWQRASHDNGSTQLPVISTYVHGEAQTSLGRFVIDILYEQVLSTTSQQIELMELEP